MRNLTKRGRPRSVPLKQRSGPVFKIPIRDGGKREIDWPVAHRRWFSCPSSLRTLTPSGTSTEIGPCATTFFG